MVVPSVVPVPVPVPLVVRVLVVEIWDAATAWETLLAQASAAAASK